MRLDMLELVKIDNYSADGYTNKTVYALFLEGVPLVNVNAYLYEKSKTNGSVALRNRAQKLKSFISQTLVDNTKWMLLGDTRSDGTMNRYVVANQAYLNLEMTDQYITSYLSQLARGEAKFSNRMPLQDSSIRQHIEAIRDFYNFSYTYGFTSKKRDYSYLYERYNQKQTATIGLDKSIHDLYYDKKSFLSIIGHISNKSKFLRLRNIIILKLCYFCGLRPNEIVRSYNFSIKRLKELIKSNTSSIASVEMLLVGKGKGIGKIRKIVLTPEVVKDLKKYLYDELPLIEYRNNLKIEGNIFVSLNGKPIKASSNFNDFLWKKAKNSYIAKNNLSLEEIECWNRRNLYTTRHCFATNLIIERRKEGKRLDQVAIKELMGHSRFDTTLASYIYLAAILTMDKEMESMAIQMADSA